MEGGWEVKEVSGVVSEGSGSPPERYTLTGFRVTACQPLADVAVAGGRLEIRWVAEEGNRRKDDEHEREKR